MAYNMLIDACLNIFILIGISFSTPLFVSVGILLAIPVSVIVDIVFNGEEINYISFVGFAAIVFGFLLISFAESRLHLKAKKIAK